MPRSAFPRTNRLLNRVDFDAVFERPSFRASSAEFLVLALANVESSGRLGMVVSKKTARTSVNRNRLKRLIRESFRQEFREAGLDIVVVSRPKAGTAANKHIFEVLENLWQQVSLKKRRSIQ